MLKKLILAIVALTTGLLILVFTFQSNNQPSNSETEQVLGSPKQSGIKYLLNLKDEVYSALIYEIPQKDIANLNLSSNLDEQKATENIFEEEKCKFLTNAGFYSKQNSHIGLFISEGEKLSKFQPNALFNGFLTINQLDTARITRTLPQDELKIAIQTGPVLIENSSKQVLELKTDKNARRIVAATTGVNSLVFIVIYESNSVFVGPKLIDLPKFLSVLEKESGIVFADAINLDGGTASAFLTDDFQLTEAKPIGGYFCLK